MAAGAEIWVPALLSAVSAGVGYYNNQKTLNAQNEATQQGLIEQKKLQDQANADVNSTLNQLSKSTPDQQKAASQAQFMTALQRARSAASGSTPQVAGANARYGAQVSAGQAANNASEAGLASDYAGSLAPQLQRQDEGNQIQNLASQIAQVRDASQGQNFLTNLRVRSAQNNPWLTLLAGGIAGVGKGIASGSIGTSAKSGIAGTPQLYDTVTPYDTRGYA